MAIDLLIHYIGIYENILTFILDNANALMNNYLKDAGADEPNGS